MVRRDAFLAVDGFDTGYDNDSIEDIELGGRRPPAGYPIRIVKDFQAKHMKRWTFWGMIRCDIFQRGIPWTRLLLAQGGLPNDMNVKHSQRLSVLLSGLMVAALAVAAWFEPWWLLLPVAVFAAVVLVDLITAKLALLSAVGWPAVLVLAATAFTGAVIFGEPLPARAALATAGGAFAAIAALSLYAESCFRTSAGNREGDRLWTPRSGDHVSRRVCERRFKMKTLSSPSFDDVCKTKTLSPT